MEESYCIKDKRITPSVEPKGYQKDKRGRTQFYCRCGDCGFKKVRYLSLTPIIVTNDDGYDSSIENENDYNYN